MEGIFLLVAKGIGAFMLLAFWLSIILKRQDIVDVFWGLIILFGITLSYGNSMAESVYSSLLLVLFFAWCIRLSGYILVKNFGKGEDYRYLNWRKSWGKTFYIRSFFQVFLLQGTIIFVLILPAISAFIRDSYNQILVIIGTLMWLFGFYLQYRGDKEMYEFKMKKENKGKLLQTGLRSYIRYPQYLGEILMWWGIYVYTFDSLNYFILSPILMTLLLLYVSGRPMLENNLEKRAGFENYKRRVPAFLPKIKKHPN